MEGTMQYQTGATRLGGAAVGQLELAEDLRLTDHHRVEAGADPEQMVRGVTALEAIERAGEQRRIDFAVGGEEPRGLVDGACGVGRYADDLDPVAGRNQRGLSERRRTILEPAERSDDFAVGVGQSLADRHRGAAMIDADDEKLLVHLFRNCATKRQPKLPPCLPGKSRLTLKNEPNNMVKTASVNAAARRPRHPAAIRDSNSAAYSSQVINDHASRGSHDQKWPQVASAHSAPLTIASDSITKPQPSRR
jgi:hypothetical protein